jgi:hypothetical protein
MLSTKQPHEFAPFNRASLRRLRNHRLWPATGISTMPSRTRKPEWFCVAAEIAESMLIWIAIGTSALERSWCR